jgi:hypothetical protein
VHTGFKRENLTKGTNWKTMRRWEDNIKMDLREVGMDWIDLAQDRDRWEYL